MVSMFVKNNRRRLTAQRKRSLLRGTNLLPMLSNVYAQRLAVQRLVMPIYAWYRLRGKYRWRWRCGKSATQTNRLPTFCLYSSQESIWNNLNAETFAWLSNKQCHEINSSAIIRLFKCYWTIEITKLVVLWLVVKFFHLIHWLYISRTQIFYFLIDCSQASSCYQPRMKGEFFSVFIDDHPSRKKRMTYGAKWLIGVVYHQNIKSAVDTSSRLYETIH